MSIDERSVVLHDVKVNSVTVNKLLYSDIREQCGFT